jgi:dihydrofolate synthase/folylpolyglutamate synthase
VIEDAVNAQGCSLWVKGKDFDGVGWITNQGEQIFTYRGHNFDLVGLTLPLFGLHQVENAAVALAVYEVACQDKTVPPLTSLQLRSGVELTRWPGRFERLSLGGVPIVLDGAHNEEGARRLAQSLVDYGHHWNFHTGWVMVLGILHDKRALEMMRFVLPLAKVVLCTAPAVGRAEVPEVLAAQARLLTSVPVRIVSGVAEAIDEALDYRSPVCCWGSLYTVNEARQAIYQS